MNKIEDGVGVIQKFCKDLSILGDNFSESQISHGVAVQSLFLKTNKQNNRFHMCICLHMLAPGNGTIRRCVLFGVGVSLLEGVCHCGFKTLLLAASNPVFS